jgi:tetratricopeptide (TPR) repeat protein
MDLNSQEHIKAIAPEVAKSYRLGKEHKYVEAYNVLVPHFEAKEIPSYFEEPCGWSIYRYLKNNENKLSSLEIRKALSFYLSFASCKPSALHSCIMVQATNLEKKHENDFRFIEFCQMWNLNSFREEDYIAAKGTTESGKSIEFKSLAENVATRLYKELKLRHTEEFVTQLFPFFHTVKEKCPENRFIGMYIAQLYYWQNNKEKAIQEYKNILKTAPEWFVWKNLGDICVEENVRISLYCKAMTMMGKDEYVGDVRLCLAKLLLETNKEQAAFEIEQYMSTYKEKGWKIAGEVYMLQSRLSGVAPSSQARKFYRDNVEEAEKYVYSDIPVYELTYKGIVTNNAGKEKASLVNKREKIYIRTSLTNQLRKASVGDVFLVRVFKQEKKQIALTVLPSGKRVEVTPQKQTDKQDGNCDIVTISGVVSLPTHGCYCFIDHQYYVPEKLTTVNNLKEGDRVNAKAKKMPDGRWRVVSILKNV